MLGFHSKVWLRVSAHIRLFMMHAVSCLGLVPAGGIGQRFGGKTPKQYIQLGHVCVIEWSVNALLNDARIRKVLVVVAPQDTQAQALFASNPKVQVLPIAGATRAHTVMHGLQHALGHGLLATTDFVVVHDAARPGLSAKALSRLLDACLQHNRGGLLALPVRDTLKHSQTMLDGQVLCQGSLDRDSSWLAQTPQMFPAQMLLDALAKGILHQHAISDEASAMEHLGYKSLLIEGHLENMKLTCADDLMRLARLLRVLPIEARDV